MKKTWKVWLSGKRSIYIRIALKYWATPWRVYHLGHGGKCKSRKDMKILSELKRHGIISQIYPW